MASRYAVLAFPLALGLACSHAKTSSNDHTGAMWTEGSDNAAGAPSGDAAVAQGDQAQPVTVAATGSSDEQSGSGSMGGSQDPSGSSGGTGAQQGGGGAGPEGTSQAGGSTGSETGGSPEPKAHKKTVSGKLTEVTPEEVTVTPKSGQPMTLHVSTDTKVTSNGKTVDMSQLKQGQWVKASYTQQGGNAVATKIDLGKSKHHARTPSSGSSSHPSGGAGMESPSGPSGGSNQ